MFLIAVSAQAQTKKIYNANASAFGPGFNWNSSDNMGEIMDYEEIIKYHYDSSANLFLAVDTSTGVDSIISDSIITVFEKRIISDTISTVDSSRKKKIKFQQGPSKKELKKSKKEIKIEKGLESEIRKPLRESELEKSQPRSKGVFMLLLIPIGYLMVKKK